MSRSGGSILVSPNGFAQEHSPDLNGRRLFRLFAGDETWLAWEAPELVESSAASQASGWRSTCISVFDREPVSLFVARGSVISGGDARSYWALKLDAVETVDRLVDRLGFPPGEVQDDWSVQSQNGLNPDSLLSHLIAAGDGRLMELHQIEGILQQKDLTWNDLGDENRDRVLRRLHDETNSSNRQAGELAHRTLRSLLEVSVSQRTIAQSLDNGSTKTPEMSSVSRTQATLLISHGPIGSRSSQRLRKRARTASRFRWLVITFIGINLAGVCAWLLWPSQKNPQLALEASYPSAPSTTTYDLTAVDHANLAPSSATDPPSTFLPADGEMQVIADPDRVPDEHLRQQAAHSLQALLKDVGDNRTTNALPSIRFESVEAVLKETGDEAIIQQSLQESVSDNAAMTPSASPFSEPLDAVPMESTDASKGASEIARSVELSPPLLGEPVSQLLSLEQSRAKTTFRVPFQPIERQAVCRVSLRLPDRFSSKPFDPAVLVGRQETKWMIANEDDRESLVLYLRTIPARTWYVAYAIRLRLDNDTEMAIGPKDAIQVCQRLQNYLRWLDQNRLAGEALRGNPKTKAMVSSALKEIDKQIKATEKSLTQWTSIERLVRSFYAESALEIELASSIDALSEK